MQSVRVLDLGGDSPDGGSPCGDSTGEARFEVTLADGRTFRTRRVVCAMGPGEAAGRKLSRLSLARSSPPQPTHAQPQPAILRPHHCPLPTKPSSLRNQPCCGMLCTPLMPGPMFAGMRANSPWWCEELLKSMPPRAWPGRVCHSSQLVSVLRGHGLATSADAAGAVGGGHAAGTATDKVPIAVDQTRWLEGKRILVVGGGQTAGHLSLLAIKAGCARVVLVARRQISVKPYDVDLELVGDQRAGGHRTTPHHATPHHTTPDHTATLHHTPATACNPLQRH